MTVLVLAQDFDPTADAVVMALTERQIPVFRTDLSAFPQCLHLDARLSGGQWIGRLWNDHRSVALEGIRSIWNRHPRRYSFSDSLTAQQQQFCYTEARLGLGGVLAALDVLWANNPNRVADSIFKPCQWKIAVECGLAVADTLITNDIATARRFVGDAPEETITKALGPTGITDDGQVKVAYARRLTAEDLADSIGVSATATTLQRFVPKAFEVRLTVIGRQLFPIAIHADSDAGRTDWRSDPAALRYEIITVPATVTEGVARYMRRTGLAYAGFDFVVTPSGEFVMLEANSGPQIGWLAAATGTPLVAAMATMLAEGVT